MNLLPARAYAALSGIALIAYYFLPPSLADVGYDAFGLASVAAIGWFVLSGRITRGRGAWVLFGAANLLWVVGDLATAVLTSSSAAGTPPFPSIADGIYLIAYPVLAVAIVWAARLRGPTRDLISTLDGLMVASAAAIPVWVIWVAPALEGSGLSAFEAGVSISYPVMDLMLIVAGVRFILGSGVWNTSAVLLAAGLIVTVVADVAYNVAILAETYAMPDPIDAGWLVGYAAWGVAALHPSASQVLDRGPARYGVPLRSRLWILVAIVTLPLAVIAAGFMQGRTVDLLVVIVPVGIICCSMVLRLRLLARSASSANASSWRAAALLSAAGFLVVSVSVALTQVHAHTEHQERISDGLLETVALTERVDGVAARTLSAGPDVSLSVWRDLEVERVALERRFAALRSMVTTADHQRVEAAEDHYLAAVKHQTDLVHADRLDEAAAAGTRDVIPAHAALIAELRAVADHYRVKTERSAELGRVGTVVVLVLALLMLTALLLKYGGVSRAAQVDRARNRATQDSEQRLAALVSGSPDIIAVIDIDSTFARHTESAERVLGYPAGALLSTRLDQLLRPSQVDRVRDILASLDGRPGASETFAFEILRHDGSWSDVEARVVNQTGDPLLGGYVITIRDVTERKQLEAELEHQAFHDPLTGLANRPLLTDRLRQALTRSAAEFELQAMVLLDIDDFRAVNDSLGHGRGDDLLREIARRLSNAVRSQDTLARVGGDAFALLMEDVESESDALRTAERMLEALQASPIDLDGGHHQIRASIGLAVTDGRGMGSVLDQSAELLRNAELAMYEAKRDEGGRIEVFESHMHDSVTKRLELKGELILALQREEFSLVYQPIVDIAERRIAGYEALVRWIHPVRGMVSPADFIPIAEQTGLIVELGTWVLREACRQVAEWEPTWAQPRYVSVNVAGHQLQREDFVKQVRSALADSGFDPKHLLLEMTESSLIQDTEGSERRINELRALGVRLAIDDFGTGYSSLSYLHRFSIDVLKIDKSFIDRVTEEGRGSALVDAIVNMASSLGLAVVAEGIEEVDQLVALAAMGCDLGQGYHYSRPLPAADVLGFVLAPGPAAPERQTPLRVVR